MKAKKAETRAATTPVGGDDVRPGSLPGTLADDEVGDDDDAREPFDPTDA